MERVRLWLTCAAMHDLVSPVLTQPVRIGWEAKERIVDLEIERPLRGAELLSRMKGWVTVDVKRLNQVISQYGRLKLLDERRLVVECEGSQDLALLQKEIARNFGEEVVLERLA